MFENDSEFFKELLDMFRVESEEHLKEMSTGLTKLESATGSDQRLGILETVFRAAHSLKGAARAVGLTDIEPIGQSLEAVFATMKQANAEMDVGLSSTLHQTITQLEMLIHTMDDQGKVDGDKTLINHLLVDMQVSIANMRA